MRPDEIESGSSPSESSVLMDPETAVPPLEELVTPAPAPIKLTRRIWRSFGLVGTKNPSPRPGFFGPNRMPRLWLTHPKQEVSNDAPNRDS